MNYQYIHYFKDITIDDIPQVGGKNALLGEMYCRLTSQGVNIPNGFAVSAQAYRYILNHNNAWEALDNMDDLAQ